MIQIFDIKKHKKLENNDDELLNRYIAESKKNASTILEDLQTTPNGISEKEAEERLNKFGANVVIKNEKKSRIYFLAQSFKDKFIIILIMLAIINYFISDALSAYIILGIALLSALIRYFQDYSVYKFNQSLKSKLYTVTHILRNGKEKEIKVEKVVKGDVVKLNAGSMIPADLYLIDSKDLFINQSVFTGESAPIEKKAISEENNCKEIFNIPNICLMGASVISGSATGVVIEKGFSTYLGRMGKEIDNKRELTNFEKGMNNITKMLIKYMIIVSFSVFAIYGLIRQNFLEAILFALSVAVGITPSMLPMIVNVNLTRGTKVLAKKKTLVKNINSIQNLGAIDILCTDKTGTLTKGTLTVSRMYNYSNKDEKELLKDIASLENKSEHPIARAIVNKAQEDNISLIDVKDFKAIPGFGIEGKTSDEKHYLIGNKKLMLENNVELTNSEDEQKLISDGNSILFVSLNKKLVALLGVSDVIKENVPQVITELKSKNINVVMLTGDNEKTANVIANQIGITNVVANVTPKEKAETINKLKEKGLVMMCGDGINDSVSLVTANIGVSVSSGTDIARDSAQVVIMNDNLERINDLLDISSKTVRNIKQNLFWAFFYNVCMIPIAAGILQPLGITLNPMIAAFSMTISSLTVVLNALRLRRK